MVSIVTAGSRSHEGAHWGNDGCARDDAGMATLGPLCYVRTVATIQEAVQNAVNFARETLGPGRTEGLQLEEVESASVGGEDAWLITLSMPASGPGAFFMKRDIRDIGWARGAILFYVARDSDGLAG